VSGHKGFTIRFPEVHLSVEDIRPDGDAPENPSCEDVLSVMEKCGSSTWVAREWNLIGEIEVWGNGTTAVFR
jgi:hypothetical protein